MNCCDEYGQCTQGRDCPVRTEVTLQSALLDSRTARPPRLLGRMLGSFWRWL